MPLLPYHRFELVSPLPPSAVAQVLEAATRPPRSREAGGARVVFEGAVNGRTFSIRRIIGYRNSFLPQITGSISEIGTGSRVAITTSLHPLTLVFMGAWMSVAVMGFLIPFVGSESVGLSLAPGALMVFGWGLCTGAFSFELAKAKQHLSTLLAAESTVARVPPGEK